MKPRKLMKRAWLNPVVSHDDGWIKYEVEAIGKHMLATFTIADCSRTISLDLSCSPRNKKDYEHRMQKLNRLRQAIDEIQDKLTEWYEYFNEDGDSDE